MLPFFYPATNPCVAGTDNCDDNSMCVFGAPGFTCECFPGYQKNDAGQCESK